MRSTTNPQGQGMQTPTATTTAGGENRRDAQRRHRIEGVLWVVGFIILLITYFIIHAHPQPYPIDLSTTETVQHAHIPSWLLAIINFPSVLNDPIPSAVALAVWFVGLLLIGFVRRVRQLLATTWFMSVILLVLMVC